MTEEEKAVKAGIKLEHERLAKVALGARLRNEEESRLAREFAAAGEVSEQRRLLELFKDKIDNQENPEWAEWAIQVIKESRDVRYL